MIDEWAPQPGVLIEITPTDDAVGRMLDAPVSTVKPTAVQRFHLRHSYAERQRGNVPAAMCVRAFMLAGPLDEAALQRAAETFVRRHETLRSWFRPDSLAGTGFVRHLADDGPIGLRIADRVRYTRSADLREAVTRVVDAHAGRLHGVNTARWPAFFVCAVDHGTDCTVIFGVDHVNSDGNSLDQATYELTTAYEAYRAGTVPELAEPGSFVEFARVEPDSLEAADTDIAAVRDLVAAMRRHPNGYPQPPIEFGLSGAETAPGTLSRTTLLDGTGAANFESRCHSSGAGFGAALFAALALTEAALDGRRIHEWLSLRSTRLEPRFATAQGWFVNIAPTRIERDEGDGFNELAAAAAAAVRATHVLGAIPMLDLLATDPAGIPPITPMVSYLDLRRLPSAGLPNLHAHHSFRFRRPMGRSTQTWFDRHADRVEVTMQHPDTPIARTTAARYLATLRETMTAIAQPHVMEVR
ncbi:hypothetical protein AB0G00_12285 [Nocardia salmonicida]|uniref:hypothetical protein n=1 Tax=Nocardia salmonicida TaxID=53431 RepID=UPI0033E5A343